MLNPYDYLDQLDLHPLPNDVQALLAHLAAPPRLIAHLLLVHDVALRLSCRMQRAWPTLALDLAAIQFGAATHDVGKIVHPGELIGPGHHHERAGQDLLLRHGIAASHARFAQTHGHWKDHDHVEDVVVVVADTCWKGTRDYGLEQWLIEYVSRRVPYDPWEVLLVLDTMIEALAAEGDRRLAWQAQFPVALPS